MTRYLRPRLDEWMDRAGVLPGPLRDLVVEVQRSLVEAPTMT
ncbi:hypothetical protein [Streptomyces sp. NPDC003023]